MINFIFSYVNQIKYFIYEIILLRIQRIKFLKIINKNNPRIDIILPTYQRAEMLLERSIPSVLNQTYKNFRLIIIGDCCKDNTEQVVKKFNDNRVFFYNIPYRKKRYPESPENHWFAGPVVAINKGLEFVESDWIARIDDDDIWTDDHLEKLLDFAIKSKSEFVSSSYIVEKKKKKIIKNCKDEKPPVGGVQTWLYVSYLKFFKSNINCWRKKINRVNDLDLQDRMHRVSVKMSYLEDVTCIIKPRPGETEVGSKAYFENKDIYLKKYKFYD